MPASSPSIHADQNVMDGCRSPSMSSACTLSGGDVSCMPVEVEGDERARGRRRSGRRRGSRCRGMRSALHGERAAGRAGRARSPREQREPGGEHDEPEIASAESRSPSTTMPRMLAVSGSPRVSVAAVAAVSPPSPQVNSTYAIEIVAMPSHSAIDEPARRGRASARSTNGSSRADSTAELAPIAADDGERIPALVEQPALRVRDDGERRSGADRPEQADRVGAAARRRPRRRSRAARRRRSRARSPHPGAARHPPGQRPFEQPGEDRRRARARRPCRPRRRCARCRGRTAAGRSRGRRRSAP